VSILTAKSAVASPMSASRLFEGLRSIGCFEGAPAKTTWYVVIPKEGTALMAVTSAHIMSHIFMLIMEGAQAFDPQSEGGRCIR
jgi:hypothetical protein